MFASKGDFLHIEPDNECRFIRHATSFEDLESPSVSLAIKFGFLDKCGLHCFQKYVDRNLRNKIAHMDFGVDEKGNFFTYQRKST